MTFRKNVGRLIMSASLLSTAIAPWLADWNSTHIFSEQWSSHARFHGVSYLCMAFGASVMGLWALWRPTPDRDLGHIVGALIPILYWGPFFIALLVPGTAVEDPGHALKRVMGIPVNVMAAAGQVLLSVVGFILYKAFKTDNEHVGSGMEG